MQRLSLTYSYNINSLMYLAENASPAWDDLGEGRKSSAGSLQRKLSSKLNS